MTELPGDGWWTRHAAWEALVGSFRRSTRSPALLAMRALVGLRAAGFEVVRGEVLRELRDAAGAGADTPGCELLTRARRGGDGEEAG